MQEIVFMLKKALSRSFHFARGQQICTLISSKLLHYESYLPHSEKVKMGFNKEEMYCVVPENIHTSPEDGFWFEPSDPPGISSSASYFPF